MNSRIVTLQIGQCGIRMGHEFWKELCKEHKVNPDGSALFSTTADRKEQKELFFQELPTGLFLPRTILFDLKPKFVSSIFKGTHSNIYNKFGSILSTQSTGNNWAIGYHQTINFQFDLENCIRKNVEKLDHLTGFSIFNSIIGGTGSGATSFILEIIRDEFSEKFINTYSVISEEPSATNIIVYPYNSILSLRWLSLYCDCVFLFSNAQIENILHENLANSQINFFNINKLIAKFITVFTRTIRFSYHNDSIASIIPSHTYSLGLHYFIPSIYEHIKSNPRHNFSHNNSHHIIKMFNTATLKFNPDEGKFISSCYFLNHETNFFEFFISLKKKYTNYLKFIDWTPLISKIPKIDHLIKKTEFYNTDVALFNHTYIKKIFKQNLKQYNIFKQWNAFINTYFREFDNNDDGQDLFNDAEDTIKYVIKAYDNIEILHQ